MRASHTPDAASGPHAELSHTRRQFLKFGVVSVTAAAGGGMLLSFALPAAAQGGPASAAPNAGDFAVRSR